MLAMWNVIDDSIINYFQCLINIDFCDYIKKLRAYKLRETISKGTEEELLESYNEIKQFNFNPVYSGEIWSLDDILPEDFLINWRREIDDFLVCQEETPNISEDASKIFRLACKNAIESLREDIKSPHITDVLSNISESRIFLDENYHLDKNTTSVRTAYRKNINQILKFDFLNKSPNIYKRQTIYVSPANERDSWIPNLDTRLRNTYYDRLFYYIFHKHPSFMMIEKQDFDKKISKFENHDGFFVMVDIKKEGLSNPYLLIKILCEELDKVYNFNFLYIYKCIKNQKVLYKGDWKTTKRGRGLGMLNFMSCAIHCIISDILSYKAIIFIDDVTWMVPVKLNTLESAKVCLNNIYKLYTCLGFEMSKRKSIISKSFVFLEEYYKTELYGLESDKYLRSLMAILNSIFCDSIAEFKKRVYNYALSLNLNKVFWRGLKELLRQLSSEFINEAYMPDWELEVPPYLGGFGLCNVESNFDNELNYIGTLNADICHKLNIILDNQKDINTTEVILEHKPTKLDRELIYEIEYQLNETDSKFYRDLFRNLDKELRVKELEKNLNIVSKKNNRSSNRIRQRILYINKKRENLLVSKDHQNGHIHPQDLVFKIIEYNNLEGIRNFAIPEFMIEYSQVYAPELIDGGIDRNLPIIFNREDMILSYLWNKGVLNKKPPITIIKELVPYFGIYEVEDYFSSNGKVIKRFNDFIKQQMDILPFVLTFNVNPEFALIDFVVQKQSIPRKFFSSYIDEEWQSYKSLFIEGYQEYSDYIITGENKVIDEYAYKLWSTVAYKIPQPDRAICYTRLYSDKDLQLNRSSCIRYVNYLAELYHFEALDTKLYNEEFGEYIDQTFQFSYYITVEGIENEAIEDFMETNQLVDIYDDDKYIYIPDEYKTDSSEGSETHEFDYNYLIEEDNLSEIDFLEEGDEYFI